MECFEDLHTLIAEIKDQGDVILMGDFNARTRTLPDSIVDEDNTYIPVSNLGHLYQPNTTGMADRNNMDKGSNSYGPKLIELCTTVPLRILNGRKLGDIEGNYTCYTGRGRSAVDYGIVSPNLFIKIKDFLVGNIWPHISDHTPISLSLKVKVKTPSDDNSEELLDKPRKISWDKDKAEHFTRLIEAPASREIFESINKCGITQTQAGIDATATLFSEVLTTTASLAGMAVKAPSSKKPGPRKFIKVRPPKWHDQTCNEALSKVKHSSYLLRQNPNNPWIRGKLTTESKRYKSLVKSKQSEFVKNIFCQLDSVESQDPKAYYERLSSLKNGSFDKKKSGDTDSVNSSDWLEHFKSLLGPKINQTTYMSYLENYVKENRMSVVSELDQPITVVEVKRNIKRLKNNKATAFDAVSNEMLKAGCNILGQPLAIFFNAIAESETFPSEWKKDILGPLHKSGPLDDPNNFRGICVSSCLGKLFNSILRERLVTFIDKHNIMHKNQGSNCKGARTSDHLLVLRFLIDKYVKQGKHKLYACFLIFERLLTR